MPAELFTDDDAERWLARVAAPTPALAPLATAVRRPVHVLYGGARRFTRGTPRKLGLLARAALDEHLPTPQHLIDRVGLVVDLPLAEEVHKRLTAKLDEEPIEDFRIDFEDGLGACNDDDEDQQARRTAIELAHLILTQEEGRPPFIGLRPRALHGPTAPRALRTLRLFLSTFLDEGGRGELRVTLPKVSSADEVACLAELCQRVEDAADTDLTLVVEVMVESPAALVREGRLAVRRFVEAGAGRVESVHLGTYDYTASLGVAPAHQRADHPAAELARQCLLLDLAGTGCEVSDGATHRLPLPVHRIQAPESLTADQVAENEEAVTAGLRLHAASITHALASGIRRGWDLHPTQLLARYAAVFAFYLHDQAGLASRLASYVARGGEGAVTGSDWDDAASARALMDHFRRGRACGAFTDDDLRRAGLQ